MVLELLLDFIAVTAVTAVTLWVALRPEEKEKKMKKLTLFLVVCAILCGCASLRCVGSNPEARRSIKSSQARTYHFNPH